MTSGTQTDRKVAMSMQELFYGESESAFFAHYGPQTSVAYSYAHESQLPETRSRHVELSTFDLMVPMCCTRCEDQVRNALLASRSVQDVVCDPYNQRVAVTGYLDPVQALKQVKRVKNGATFWPTSGSSHSKQYRYEVSSYQKSHRGQQDNRDRRSYVQYDTREQRSYPDHSYNRPSSSNSYSRSFCPAYKDSATTHFVSVNPTIATRVEREC